MNSLLTALTHLKKLFELDTRVTTVIEGEGEEIDTYKTNEYPLVNISIGTSTVGIGDVKHQFIVHALTQRSFSKTQNQSFDTVLNNVTSDSVLTVDGDIAPIPAGRFWKNDNKLINLDLTSDIIIKAITRLKLLNNSDDVELSNEPTLEAIKFDFLNTLDGYSCTFELAVTNNDNVCSY